MGLALPVRVQGLDPNGSEWHEMTTTIDASFGGASFPLRHAHGVGQVLLLSLPLPRSFRRHQLVETSYRTYGLVRNSRTTSSEARVVGVMFLGRHAPRDYHTNPAARYLIQGDEVTLARGERRRHDRLQLFVNLRLRRAIAGGEEQTVTENVSRAGARVLTTLPAVAGEVVVVSDLSANASATAIVRNVYAGPDRITRLNLEFPDLTSFERLLEAAGAPPLPKDPDPGEGAGQR